MEVAEDIVIVGAGIAGLATALALHRIGLKSLVLESSDSFRATGLAFLTWTNAWKVLDVLGVGDSLRQQHLQIEGAVFASNASGATTAGNSYRATGKSGEHEVRCVRRNLLAEALSNELPRGTIRFGSRVVSIEQAGKRTLVHLVDGLIIKTKVLIGCDGVNSVVAKWLGLHKLASAGRSAVRGIAEFPDGHSFGPEFLQYSGDGCRSGFVPCNEKTIYWFFTCPATPQYKDAEESPLKIKEYVLSKMGKVPKKVLDALEKTDLESVISSPLRFRWPFNLLWGNICKGNVCVAGDALHPMTPDLGQGGCSALEDGIVLARCLGEALLKGFNGGEDDEEKKIKKGLEKYAKERKWRGFELISTAYIFGMIQESNGKVMNYLRDKWLSQVMANTLLKKAEFDCGKLSIS